MRLATRDSFREVLPESMIVKVSMKVALEHMPQCESCFEHERQTILKRLELL